MNAEHQFGALRPARAEEAGNAEHFAAPHLHVEGCDAALLADLFEGGDDVAPFVAGAAMMPVFGRFQFAPEHHRDEFDSFQALERARADQPAVTQHRHTVADAVDLVEEVGDEDDAETPRLEIGEDREETIDLCRIQARRRLVENQNLAGNIDGPGDRDDLANRDGIGRQKRRNVDRQAVALKDLARAPVDGAAVDEAEALGLATEKQIFRNGEVRQEIDLLIDRADAERLGMHDVAGIDRRAIEAHLPAIPAIGTGQNLDEGGFPRPVLAEQSVDLAGTEIEIDLVQRGHAMKVFRQPSRFEKGSLGRHRDSLHE